MFNLFRKPPVEKRIEVIQRDSTTLSLKEWRSDQGLVGQAASVHANPTFKLMRNVMENEHPARMMLPSSATLEQRALFQSLCEGYNLALSNLEALAKLSIPGKPLESTYQPPDDLPE